MLYPEMFKKMELARWHIKDIPWQKFKPQSMSENQFYAIRMNAILEWSAMPTAEMFLRDNQHDSDFSAFISIWFFEEQKHSLIFLEYLRRFAPEYLPTESELAGVRFSFDPAPALESLALHFCGEIRLNQWYRCANAWHTEPVIKHIYSLLAHDEARHARAYFEFMKAAIQKNEYEAKLAFSKIGLLMTNARLNKALHPTNMHVNKSMFPHDTVNGKLPDPLWLESWLDHEIKFDKAWEEKVTRGVLSSMASLLCISCDSTHALRQYRKALMLKTYPLAEKGGIYGHRI